MLLAHKLLDAAAGKGEYKLIMQPGSEIKTLAAVLNGVRIAEKLSFGRLPLEAGAPSAERGTPTLKVPDLTDDEWGFWYDGLIPLPALASWFEFYLNNTWTGCLIAEDPTSGDWTISRFDLVIAMDDNVLGVPKGNHYFSWDGLVIEFSKTRPLAILAGGGSKPRTYGLNGNQRVMEAAKRDPQMADEIAGAIPALCVYLSLMLNSVTSEVVTDPAPHRLNRIREQRGQAPLFEHRIVNIVPSHYRGEQGELGGTHAPPRLHWRRSHLRFYDRPTPKAKPYTDAKRGAGWAVVIPRVLVGHAELGQITHDYHVSTLS